MRIKTAIAIAAAGLLAGTLSACGTPGTPGAGGSAVAAQVADTQVPHRSGPGAARAPQTVPDDAVELVLGDAESLEPVLDDFWTKRLADPDEDVHFQSPALVHYSGGNSPSCGADHVEGAGNAFYCAAGDRDPFVAFDVDWLAAHRDEHPSGAYIDLVLAHEWGHAVQKSFEDEQPGTGTGDGTVRELDADCLAGVFWGQGEVEGTFIEDRGDAHDALSFLATDDPDGWTDPDAHGTVAQRWAAFSDGADLGLDYCRSSY